MTSDEIRAIRDLCEEWFDRIDRRFDRIDRQIGRMAKSSYGEGKVKPGSRDRPTKEEFPLTDQFDPLTGVLRKETPLSPKIDPSPAGMIAEFQALQRRLTEGFASVKSEVGVGFGDIRREMAEGFEAQTEILEKIQSRLDRILDQEE